VGRWAGTLWLLACLALCAFLLPRSVHRKNIEEVRAGDRVLSLDVETGELGVQRVVRTFRRRSDHLRVLTFRSSEGLEQTIRTTDEHPFWSATRREWVKAKDLQPGEQCVGLSRKQCGSPPGDRCVAPSGELQTLISTAYEPHPEGASVYNLEVSGWHTYFVAGPTAPRAPPILVHNKAIATAGRQAPIVIGENMERVNSFARAIAAETIDDWLAGREWTQELNNQFIRQMKAERRVFLDIGPCFQRRLENRLDPFLGRPPSYVYGTERRALLGYDRYRRLYIRVGKYWGGVPGFDF